MDTHLKMIIYKPEWNANVNLPAIVFFFGGGWVGGNPSHFQLQANIWLRVEWLLFVPITAPKTGTIQLLSKV